MRSAVVVYFSVEARATHPGKLQMNSRERPGAEFGEGGIGRGGVKKSKGYMAALLDGRRRRSGSVVADCVVLCISR